MIRPPTKPTRRHRLMDALREGPHGRSLNIDADELRHLLVVLGRSDECRRGAVREIEERLPQIATTIGRTLSSPCCASRSRQAERCGCFICLAPKAVRSRGRRMGSDAGFRARHAASFERVAVVSDEDWMRAALAALSFMLPGKAKGFPVAELPEAMDWLAAD